MTFFSKCYQYVRVPAINMYRWLYYGPSGCSAWLRWKRYMPPIPCTPALISRRCKFIYYQIPKTGCSTVNSLILEVEGYSQYEGEDLHMLVKELFSYPDKERRNPDCRLPDVNEYFRFAFVRNPWSRLVSCYTDKLVGKRPRRFENFVPHYPYMRFERMSFADFARFACRIPDDLCEPHFRPQAAFFDDDEVDFIGRFERFAEDLEYVVHRLGLDRRFLKWCNTHVNVSRKGGRHYTEFYDAGLQRLVGRKYATDIARFGYRFGD